LYNVMHWLLVMFHSFNGSTAFRLAMAYSSVS
jgi:hypothetical protein